MLGGNAKHFSSPLWNAKKARLQRTSKAHSVQTENMMNKNKLGPFAKIFAIQSSVPNGPAYDEPKLAFSQRSSSQWNEIPWQGTQSPRWRQFFWNGGGGSTGVRRKYTLSFFLVCVFLNQFNSSMYIYKYIYPISISVTK